MRIDLNMTCMSAYNRPSRLTLEAIAKLGGGKCEIVLPTDSVEDLLEIAARQISRASQQALTHIGANRLSQHAHTHSHTVTHKQAHEQ